MRIINIGLDSRVLQPDTPGYVVTWAREMGRLVDEYVVLTEDRTGLVREPVAVAPNVTAYPVHCHPALYPFAAARLAARLNRQDRFDLCSTEDPFRAGLAGALFAARTRVPLNVENHSSHLCNPFWIARKPYHRLYQAAGSRVVLRADSIRSYSPDQNATLLDLGVAPRRLFVVPPPAPPPTDISRLTARIALGLPPNIPVVLTAGRIEAGKNTNSLLRAFAAVHARRPTILLVAGDGPDRRQAAQVAESLGLGDSVRWLGRVPERQMPRLYAAADVFAAASHHETGPRTVLEAFAAGCPVVGTFAMGVVHYKILSHAETGLVVAPTDTPGLAEALEMILDDPLWARRMAAEGRRRIQDYSFPAIAGRVLAMFEETIRRGPGFPLLENKSASTASV